MSAKHSLPELPSQGRGPSLGLVGCSEHICEFGSNFNQEGREKCEKKQY